MLLYDLESLCSSAERVAGPATEGRRDGVGLKASRALARDSS